ncbi:2-oxo-4-hydroxy-4-carboxy-5-ureidoimidazoline decarboxylase [Ramlibacter alkalitolerans]|uniref:2-oxo-4-hydroxy-4-carboxy-5-ureidoimidazoline decarboxylase n=1 Tax=Ramlibacter alkalitolerans TaxID=2039631 RepID=A0ABS1JIH8_9BURK|nr:2-oxo-4-hydroxy-4-carboxy-5-ureidoimidazoline decarboxylase [Ramlibacter alkalitolerans]MBL0424033.1 2-oxo-4-hydroxy-4-carboxy-5-ureidoimidazoline decarboxylase [Ramlibacter alkalitolerans]
MTTTTATPPALELAEINAMDRDRFVASLGATFEHSPWVAEGAWAARPFGSVDDLHAAMIAIVRRAPQAVQVAFLCAHPELAGREAQASTLTDHSQREQASAGLDALSREEMAEMSRLNAEYRRRHGFPFIIAVRRHTKSQIFDALRSRVAADTVSEFVEALDQIAFITRARLRALVPVR